MEELLTIPAYKSKDHSASYLIGGGEMGRLTRQYNWSTSSMGEPEQWPNSLLVSLGVILNSKFPMFIFWGQEQICFYNDAYRPSLGNNGKHPSTLGKKGEEVWPEIWADIKPIIDQVLAGKGANWSEDQLLPIYRNGQMETVYWTYSYSPIPGENGVPAGVFVTCVETTDKINNAKRLKESENNLRNIFLQSPIATGLLKGPSFVVEIANERMLELWGKTSEDVMNKPLFNGLPEAKGQGFEELLSNVYTTGETFRAYNHKAVLPRSGTLETVYINFVYEAFREGDGSIAGIMAVAIDVTDQVHARKEIEEVVQLRTKELAEVNHRLQQSNTELNEFAYIASHDLQEPLRKIKTFTQLMHAFLTVIPEKAKMYIDKIQGSTQRMQTLIDDVLKFSMLSKNGDKSEKVNLNTIIKNILYDYELLIEQKGATITVGSLPVIEAIPIQMGQLFTNLLSNSLKFVIEKREPAISVRAKQLSIAEVEQHQDFVQKKVYYQIEFTDNGIGFNNDNAQQIFAIFQRLHGRSEYEGTGIGLAVCKKICINHNGIIYANSQPGEGSTFIIILPEVSGIAV